MKNTFKRLCFLVIILIAIPLTIVELPIKTIIWIFTGKGVFESEPFFINLLVFFKL